MKDNKTIREDWEDEFDSYMLDEYGKWKIGRVEAKNFIRTLFTSHTNQRVKEEREKCRLMACPCGCDMFMDEDGYEEAHSEKVLGETLNPKD